MRWDPTTYVATYADAVAMIDSVIKPKILSIIELEKGAVVLECGIGSGKWSAAFALLGYGAIAMDINMKMISRAYVNFPNILFWGVRKDIRESPLIEDPVDLIFNEGVLEHFIDDTERKQVLMNFYNAVKGYVSIIVPYKSKEEDEIAYNHDKLTEEVTEAGFKVLNLYDLSFISADGVTVREMIGVNAQKV